MKYILFFVLGLVASCSSYKGHNRIDRMDVRLKGGVYNHKYWDDTLSFKRTSYYTGAKLAHDILIAKLEKKSPFYQWLGEQQTNISDCSELYIALFYKDINNHKSVPVSYLRDQIMKNGFREVVVQDFDYQIREHYAFKQWILNDHKIFAYCNKSLVKTQKIHVNMPGFDIANILK